MQGNTQKHISFRTFRKTGINVDTPVWFATLDESTCYVFSAPEAGKIKRLRNSSKAQITNCNFRGGSTEIWLDCRAHLVKDHIEIKRAHELFKEKYGWVMRITDFFSSVLGRLNRRVYIRIEL